jgi:hypothetical protein
MQYAASGRKRVCASACSRKLCVLHLRPVRLLRISHSWRFGERVKGRGRTARNRVQGNTRLDRRRKPEGSRAEAAGFAEHWRPEVDYGFIYRDCEVVMNARNIEFASQSQGLPANIGVTGLQRDPSAPRIDQWTVFRKASRMFEGAQCFGGQ